MRSLIEIFCLYITFHVGLETCIVFIPNGMWKVAQKFEKYDYKPFYLLKHQINIFEFTKHRNSTQHILKQNSIGICPTYIDYEEDDAYRGKYEICLGVLQQNYIDM